ncbi:unnamed protein product [Durusdinium trenchii]|uniref:Uncharacterized protein n=1 Tax=Durusdinium trenchii TaxID=1381693 RepID=A0ABP0QM83_9DINO
MKVERVNARTQLAAMRQELAQELAAARASEASAQQRWSSELRQQQETAAHEVAMLRSSLHEMTLEAKQAQRDAASAKDAAASSAQSAREGLQREVEAVRLAEALRRDEQVAEVLSRLEGEHFRLSVEVAQEARLRAEAEEEALELQQKLHGLRSLLERRAEEVAVEQERSLPEEDERVVQAAVQTEDATVQGVDCDEAQREGWALRLNDLETQLILARKGEGGRSDDEIPLRG